MNIDLDNFNTLEMLQSHSYRDYIKSIITQSEETKKEYLQSMRKIIDKKISNLSTDFDTNLSQYNHLLINEMFKVDMETRLIGNDDENLRERNLLLSLFYIIKSKNDILKKLIEEKDSKINNLESRLEKIERLVVRVPDNYNIPIGLPLD